MTADETQAAMQRIGEFANEWATAVSERMNAATAAINEAVQRASE